MGCTRGTRTLDARIVHARFGTVGKLLQVLKIFDQALFAFVNFFCKMNESFVVIVFEIVPKIFLSFLVVTSPKRAIITRLPCCIRFRSLKDNQKTKMEKILTQFCSKIVRKSIKSPVEILILYVGISIGLLFADLKALSGTENDNNTLEVRSVAGHFEFDFP